MQVVHDQPASQGQETDLDLLKLVDQVYATIQSICGRDVLPDSEDGELSEATPPSSTNDVSAPMQPGDLSKTVQRLHEIHPGDVSNILRTLHETHLQRSDVSEHISPVFFRLFAALSAASGLLDGDVRTQAGMRLAVIAAQCSPREVLVAVQERLDILHGRSGQVDRDARWCGAYELAQLHATLGQALPRLKTKQPEKFLSSLVPLLLAAVKGQAKVEFARSILGSTRLLCQKVQGWLAGALLNAHLALLALGTIQVLSPYLDSKGATLAHRLFLTRHSRYRLPSHHQEEEQENNSNWQAAEDLCSEMNIDARDTLLHSTDERCRLGAFVLLNKALMQPHPSSSALEQKPTLDDLGPTLPLILAALRQGCSVDADEEGPSPASDLVDCALVWSQLILDERAQSQLPEHVLLPLCQAVSVHAALSPIPAHRHISLHVFGVLCHSYATDDVALELIVDVLDETLFPQLKSAVIGVLKDLWIKRDVVGDAEDDSGASLLSPAAFERLKKGLFAVPLPLPVPPAMQHLSSYMAVQFAVFNEALNLLFLILRRPSLGHRLGFSTHTSQLRMRFIDPLDSFVTQWEEFFTTGNTADDNDVLSSLSLLRMTLSSVKSIWPHET